MKTINDFFSGDLTNLYFLDEYDNFVPCDNWHLENKDIKRIYFASPYLSFGDYDNSCQVERSNVRMFLEMFKESEDIIHKFYSYGSEAIYINVATVNEEIIECLSALENYPAINDEDCFLVEMEIFEESWENWIRRDFIDKILKEFDLCDIEFEESDLLNWFNELTEQANIYFEVESGGIGYIDLDRIEIESLPENIKAINWAE